MKSLALSAIAAAAIFAAAVPASAAPAFPKASGIELPSNVTEAGWRCGRGFGQAGRLALRARWAVAYPGIVWASTAAPRSASCGRCGRGWHWSYRWRRCVRNHW